MELIFIIIGYAIFCFCIWALVKGKADNKRIKNKNLSGRHHFLISINTFMAKIGNLLPGNNKKLSIILQAISSKNLNITINAFKGYKLFLSLSFLLAGSIVSHNFMQAIILSFSGSLLGYFLPNILIKKMFYKRKQKISKDLPYAIDLLYISALSGQNIYNSIRILIDKFKGEICNEFSKLIKDIDYGIGKKTAYKNLESRPNSKEFKDLVLLLQNAENCGSSVSEILKQKSKHLKFNISQDIERKSRKISLLILFPLAFLILPSFILLVGGPLIFTIGGDFLPF